MKLKHLIPIAAITFLAGCSLFTDNVRIKGGSFKQTASGIYQTQGQDPKETTSLNQENQTLVIPAGSVMTVGTNQITLSSNAVYSVSRISNQFGAAQKNVLGLFAEKLKSLQWLTWLGAALVLFGAASAVYPPLKLIINSVTTSAVIIATGIGFIVLPSVLVGHEILVLLIGLGAAGLYFFAHRHGSIAGELQTLKRKE